MADVIKDSVSAGLDKMIDIVDVASGSAIELINQGRGVVADVAGGAVSASDALSETAVAEIEGLRAKLIARLQAAKDAVVAPLAELP